MHLGTADCSLGYPNLAKSGTTGQSVKIIQYQIQATAAKKHSFTATASPILFHSNVSMVAAKGHLTLDHPFFFRERDPMLPLAHGTQPKTIGLQN